jgi:signal transduction histidine kinase
MKLELSGVVVEDILEEILVLLEADMSRAGVELVSRLRPDPGPILADQGQLHRAFLNLLVNAIQAMPEGGLLTVETSLVKADEPQGRLVVTILDTGPGLSPEAATHLFRPFHTTKTKGTGLGLVLVRNVVESHSGRLELVNVQGGPDDHGLKVTVSLPLRTSDHPEAGTEAEEPSEDLEDSQERLSFSEERMAPGRDDLDLSASGLSSGGEKLTQGKQRNFDFENHPPSLK